MIRKITLENFMSHGTTVIELADGLTVLTGPNNCGKSALVSALQIIASNGRTTHVMRHGSKVCRITVETDDDQTIVWERKKSTVKYTINGEDVHRTGQGIPENLHDVLRLDKVTTEHGATKNEYDIHFGEQKSPVFLLNESGSRAAAFFASSSDAARLVEMQHLHRARTSKSRSEAKRLSSESEQNIARLAAFTPIDSISESVKLAEKLHSQIELQQQRLGTLTTLIERLQSSAAEVTRWQNELSILKTLDQAETTPDKLLASKTHCEKLRSWLSAAAVQTGIRDREKTRFQTLSRLQSPPAQHPAAALAMLIEKISDAHRRHVAAERITKSCVPLVPPPTMQPAEACRQTARRLAEAITTHAVAKRADETLSKLSSPPASHDTRGISKLIQQLSDAVSNHAAMKSRLAVTEELTPPPTIVSTERLEQTIRELTRAQDRHASIANRASKLEGLRMPEPPQDPKPIETMLERIKRSSSEVAQAQAKADDAQALLQQHERLIRDFVSKNPKCATCGGSIDPETLMSTVPGTHDHDDGVAMQESTA
ncbi:AAA family ATPase [Aporhodopirellula aestuarii]|uniref:AAA family ATPase n=1 Tax=Aporhodopirellula aestuarii TaxID=2950107 RepID=A0ABT0TXM6_9BACT|nr:AAA family ATPase [Aporhodopirellula aestuarii]MCM2369346.1 AAA family ATPase [Aporhodopirellula aestuarii]